MIEAKLLAKDKLRLYREGFCFDSERDTVAARDLLGHIAALESRLNLATQTLENIKSKRTPFKPEDAAALALEAMEKMN